jgi:hypothetical protein
VRLVDGAVGVGGGARVGVGDGDAPEPGAADDVGQLIVRQRLVPKRGQRLTVMPVMSRAGSKPPSARVRPS